MFKKNKTRTPISQVILRHAGQSIDDEITKNNDKFNDMAFIFSYLVGINFLGWMVYFMNQASVFITLIIIGIATIFYLCYAIYKVLKLKKHNKKLKLGRDGEKEVAQYLDTLKKEGVHIFHDVINDNKTFNIDHIVISTKGIFTIETKAYSKPIAKKAIITRQNNNLIINERDCGDKIIKQAASQARWLQEKLNQKNIQAIVAFPGWWIEYSLKNELVNVLNPKNLKNFIESGQDKLTIKEANLISTILYNHVRMSAY